MPYYEFTIRISDAFRDSLIRQLTENGCLGMIEYDDSLCGLFPISP